MYRHGLVEGMEVDENSDINFHCKAYVQAKHSPSPFPLIATTCNYEISNLIFSDIWGPARVKSLYHNTYMITFTDAASRHVAVYFMKPRAAALDRFKRYEQFVLT